MIRRGCGMAGGSVARYDESIECLAAAKPASSGGKRVERDIAGIEGVFPRSGG